MTDLPVPSSDAALEAIRSELAKADPSKRRQIFEKFFLAALGSIPWVGGFLSAAATIKGDAEAIHKDRLQTQWLEEHQRKLQDLQATLSDIQERFDSLGSQIDERVQSQEYLALVRKAFRAWDEADTTEKRRYITNVVVNSAGTRVCSDDVVRLFIDWLELYHEAHFAVVREIYKNPGVTRYDIWTNVYGDDTPRDDSAEADLFKLLIRDLSTGGVIRQPRATDVQGRFVRKKPVRRQSPTPSTMESAFEETKPYVLTELGKQFVHYTMNEVVTRIGGPGPGSPAA
jgi:hypothetical protein